MMNANVTLSMSCVTRFFVKARMCSHSIFPPTSAALKNHLKRANYQVHIWKRALEPQTPDEGPEDQGWKLSDGRLEIVWTDLAPSPEAVMELVFCGCCGICQTRRCSCVSNGLPCTEACPSSDQYANSIRDLEDEDDDDGDEEREDE